MLRENVKLLPKFYKYKAHVNNEMYEDSHKFQERQVEREAAWPLYKDSAHLLVQPQVKSGQQHILWTPPGDELDARLTPRHLASCQEEGAAWKAANWKIVQLRQERLQHHIHPPDTDAVRNVPPWCQLKNRPKECRAGFPLEQCMCQPWMQEEPSTVCHGIAKQMGLRTSGKKGSLGTVVGPRNDPCLNGTHPALLHDLACNSDTLLLYRLPVIPETHSEFCETPEQCLTEERMAEVNTAADREVRDARGDPRSNPDPRVRVRIATGHTCFRIRVRVRVRVRVKVRVRVWVRGGSTHTHTYVPTTTRATVCYIREM